MNDHRSLAFYALLTLLVLVLLAIYGIAFGATLTPRPDNYQLIDYIAASCVGRRTDTTVLRFGVDGDPRWVEIYVEGEADHQQLVAVAAFAPGDQGGLLFAEVLAPSGEVLRFEGRDALRASPYAEVCGVANLWLLRS